ncbi:MAG: hypothetical protein ACYCPP_07255 [Nitrososphaerales archaeon]
METVVKNADHEFAANLNNCLRMVLLSRLFRSTDRKAEFNFLSGAITRILSEAHANSAESAEATADAATILVEDLQNESNAKVFSYVTDFLDKLSPKGLYQLAGELRKEPIHYVGQ